MTRTVMAALVLALGLGLGQTARAVTIEDVKSPGGIEAWLVEDHATKVIALDFAFACGSSCDPADRQGLSTFALSLLDEGAGPLDSGHFQGRLTDLSASMTFEPTEDELTGTVECLSANRDEVMGLLKSALTEPRFDKDAVDRIRAEVYQAIDAREEEPGALAEMLLLRTELPGHAYARWATGSRRSIAGITTADLKNFVKTRLGRDRLIVTAAGDITPADLGVLLDRVFGGLPATASAGTAPPDASAGAPGRTILLRRPNPQTVIRFGLAGLKIHDPDYYAAMVLNRILGGGGLTSRLAQEVREKRGLAYHISTALDPRDHADLWTGDVATQNGRVAETLDVIRAEYARMLSGGPTDAELDDAKAFLKGSYTIGLTNSGAIARRLLGLRHEALGRDYFDRRSGLIDAVTAESVRRVAQRLIDPGKLVFAVVGDPAGLKPDETVTAVP